MTTVNRTPRPKRPALAARKRWCPFCGENRRGRIARAFDDDRPPYALRCRSCGMGYCESGPRRGDR